MISNLKDSGTDVHYKINSVETLHELEGTGRSAKVISENGLSAQYVYYNSTIGELQEALKDFNKQDLLVIEVYGDEGDVSASVFSLEKMNKKDKEDFKRKSEESARMLKERTRKIEYDRYLELKAKFDNQ